MWATKRFQLDEIGIHGTYAIPQIPRIDLSSLSSYNPKTKSISNSLHIERTPFHLQSQLDHGSYGNVYLASRGAMPVIVKQPRMTEMNLLQEAVLQHLAHKTMESHGIPWAVPKVYDVFRNGDEVWFSMDYIQGTSIPEWFQKTTTPDADALCILSQICFILALLETGLNLDHRDLKCNNLLIRKQPCKLTLSLFEKQWHLDCNFQVVVLDFGFACLGSEVTRGKPWVTLGDGVLPPMDPCPKEGRDMFHILISLLGLPVFRDRISSRLQKQIDIWLSDGKKAYGPMARRWSTENWSYLVSSQPSFSIPSCCPLRILQDISSHLQGSLLTSEKAPK
jgi:serine/threonine protein kinase